MSQVNKWGDAKIEYLDFKIFRRLSRLRAGLVNSSKIRPRWQPCTEAGLNIAPKDENSDLKAQFLTTLTFASLKTDANQYLT